MSNITQAGIELEARVNAMLLSKGIQAKCEVREDPKSDNCEVRLRFETTHSVMVDGADSDTGVRMISEWIDAAARLQSLGAIKR